MSSEADETEGRPGVEEQPSSALVEVEPGLAVFFGTAVPRGLELVPIELLDPTRLASLNTAIGTATGLGNLAAQAATGVAQAQGLVRLAPETLQALQTAQPMTSGGWNLGTVVSNGKIVAQVRWLPATSATAVSVAASLGPALVMLALQMQLAQISRAVQHNLELTSQVLKVLRQEQWSQVTGAYKTLHRELDNARHVGAVSDSIWFNVRGQEAGLRASNDLFTLKVRDHARVLQSKRGHKERREFLVDHGDAIIADVHGLLLSQDAWFIYNGLRAAHLSESAAHDERDAALLEKLVRDSRELHRSTLELSGRLLHELGNEIGVIAELDGKRTIPFAGQKSAARQVFRMSQQLLAALEASAGVNGLTARKPLTRPPVSVVRRNQAHELLGPLRFRLHRDETLLGAADVTSNLWKWNPRDSGWMIVTDQRVLLTKHHVWRELAGIDYELPVQDFRYVRVAEERDKGAKIFVATRTASYEVQFRNWTTEEGHREEAERFAKLLASFMVLPGEEVPQRDEIVDSSQLEAGRPSPDALPTGKEDVLALEAADGQPRGSVRSGARGDEASEVGGLG